MKKVWKIVGAIVAVAMVIIVLALGFLWWAFSPGSTNKVQSIADKFQPGVDWRLRDKTLTPPRRACLDGNCDQAHYKWIVDGTLKSKDVSELQKQSGLSLFKENECMDRVDYTCTLSAAEQNYIVQVFIDNEYDGKAVSTVNLFVSRSR